MINKEKFLTQDMLKSIMSYDESTGKFTWLIECSPRAKAGSIAGNDRINNHGYKVTQILGNCYSIHRLAFLYMTGEWPKNQVDHINGDRADNRWCNLRDVTCKQNQRNSISNNMIMYKGIYQTLTEHCEDLAISYHAAWHKIMKCGMSPDEAFEKLINRNH